MKRNRFLIASVCLTAMMLMTACNQKFPGYKKTNNGLYYKFYSQNLSAQQPKLTEYFKVNMACYLDDTLYYDFKQSFVQMKQSLFPGDLYEAFGMMRVGDSASFYVKADSVALKHYGQNPDSVGLKKDDYFRYEVKMLEVQTEQDFKISFARSVLSSNAEKTFAEYLKTNNITDHTGSGLYYSKSKVTDGAMPQVGQTARISYVATYLDGTPLGDSEQLGGHYDVPFGKGSVLKGLEEGVGLMHVGEKARFVLPYPLAYGENGYEKLNIPAYSNLIFDVELLEILNETK